MRKIFAVLLVALAVGLFTSRVRSQQTTEPQKTTAIDAETQKRLTIVRSLNTVEVTYQYAHARFADRDELLSFLREQKMDKLASAVEHPDPYDLALTTSRDGSHYQISFVRTYSEEAGESSRCPTSIFSNDSGAIFLGLGLGCSDDEKALASLREMLNH
jgi:hypothetical protein